METVYCSGLHQANALNAIVSERAYQDAKWGTIEERPKQVGSYLTLMRKLLRDAEDAWANSGDDAGALEELRKVVAVGVACFEQHGVPLRDAPAVEPAPALNPHERLVSVSNERLHKGYEAIRYLDQSVGYDFDVDGKKLTLYRSEIEAELDARGDPPIPF